MPYLQDFFHCNFFTFQVVPDGVGYWEDVLMVRQNHATIRMNRKCAGNQYFLIDDEGHDGGNKSKEHGGHVTQVSFTSKFYLLD